jgi:hypothetical protein
MIATLSAKLEKAKQLKEAIADPDLAEELERAFQNGSRPRGDVIRVPHHGTDKSLPREGSQLHRVFHWFFVHGNKPATVVTVATEVGIPRTAAGSLVYGRNKTTFETAAPTPEGTKQFRVKEETMRRFEQSQKGGSQS